MSIFYRHKKNDEMLKSYSENYMKQKSKRTISKSLDFKTNLLRILFFVSLYLLTSTEFSFSQVVNVYSFSATSGTYTPLTSPTAVTLVTTGFNSATDEGLYNGIPMGFNFDIGGTIYTQINVNANAWLTLGNAITPNNITTNAGYTNTFISTIANKPLIAPFWDDLELASTTCVKYQTSGSAPNRITTIQYDSIATYVYSAAKRFLSLQVNFYETTNKIEFVYNQLSGSSTPSASIGIGASTTDYLSLNNSTASPVASSTANTTSISSRPAQGQIYTFSPPVPCSGNPVPGNTLASVSLVCPGANETSVLSFPNAFTGVTYQWYSAPDNSGTPGAFDPIASATSSAYTATVNTATWFQCVVSCTSSGGAGTSSPKLISTSSKCISMPSTGSDTTCDALFYDHAGGSANYQSNQNRTFTLYPSTAGSRIRVTFNSFSTENLWDGLMIYNGNSTSAPLLSSGLPGGSATQQLTAPAGSYYGTNSPGTVTSTASDGTLTFVFKSDGSGVSSGWSAIVSCFTPPACSGVPSVDSTMNNNSRTDTTVCVGETNRVNLTLRTSITDGGISFQWYYAYPLANGSAGTYNPIAGATTAFYVPSTFTRTTWYKCQVTCSNGGASGYSFPIKIKFDSSCIKMPASGSWNTCSANFYDSNGPTSNYSNSENRTFTIYPSTPGAFVRVAFNTFATETNYDGLMIYDGNSTSAPLISSGKAAGTNTTTAPAGSWRGTTAGDSPGTITSSASDGSLTFVFKSDGSGVNTGWDAIVSCYTPPVCNTVPAPGNTLYNGQSGTVSLCIGAASSVSLTLQSTPTGVSGVTYKWLRSTNGTVYSAIAGATSAFYATSITQTSWYRCEVTCSATGKDTSKFIKFILDSTCINMPASGSFTTCTSTFYDAGGSSANYNNSETRTFTIYPATAGYKTKVQFTEFATESGFDKLKIYDGNNTSATLIGTYSGTTLPGSFTSTAADGSLTFNFTSDGIVNDLGWAATVSCENPPPCTGKPVPGNTKASNSTLCVGGTTNLSLQYTNYSGVDFQWQSSTDGINFTNTSAADTNSTYSPVLNDTTFFRCIVRCIGTGDTAQSDQILIVVNSVPGILSVTPGQVCTSGSVTLKAKASSSSALIKWYTASNGGTAITSGVVNNGDSSTYTTPVITNATTYYVSSSSGGGNFSGGKSIGTQTPAPDGGNVTGGLYFTAYNDLIINTVRVFLTSTGAGPWANTFYLYSGNASSGTPLLTYSYTFTNSQSGTWVNLPLNWSLSPGNYTIYQSGSASLRRDFGAGVGSSIPATSFPYNVGGLLQINGGFNAGATSTYYYTFYEWNITSVCESARTPVLADVTTPPVVSVLGTTTLCTGTQLGLTASSTNTSYAYSWNTTPTPTTGSRLRFTTSNTGSSPQVLNYTVTAQDNTLGSAFLGCGTTASVTVTVNPKPAALVITPISGKDTSVCSTPNISTLTATAASGKYPDGVAADVTWTPTTDLFTDAGATTAYTGTSTRTIYLKPNATTTYYGVAGNLYGCTTRDTANITVIPNGSLSVSMTSSADSVCSGTNPLYTAVPPAGISAASLQYMWQKKTGAGSWTGLTGYAASTTYTLTSPTSGDSIRVCIKFVGTSTCGINNGDTAVSNVKSIFVKPTPTAVINTVSAVTCSGATGNIYSATLTPSGGTETYSWSLTQTGNASITSATNTSSVTITNGTSLGYQINLNYSVNGCPGTQVTKGVSWNANVAASVSISGSNSACAGANVTFTAAPTNGGTTPAYQWKLNGSNVGTNSTTYSSSSLVNGDIVSCVMTSNATCATGSPATSNTITMTINAIPTGTIVGASSVCPTSSNSFTASVTPSGGTVVHGWSISTGSITAGRTSSPVTITAPSSGSFTLYDTITRNGCVGTPITKTVTITPSAPASVSISGYAGDTLCPNASLTLDATPTNGGASPSYQWQVYHNGSWSNVGLDDVSYDPQTAIANDGDSVRVVLTSNATCVTGSPYTSDAIKIIIGGSSSPSVTLSAPVACSGQQLTFTASATSAGSSPTYEFFLNGSSVQNSSANTYSVVPSAGQQVYVIVTSSAACSAVPTAQSNTVTVGAVNTLPTTTVSANCNSLISGTGQQITLTAGGGSTYSWTPATGLSATTGAIVTATPSSTQTYSVTATSAQGCVSASAATVTITVISGALPAGDYTITSAAGCNTFSSIANAVTYINNNGITGTGGVRFNVASGYTETAPAGGFVITRNGTSNNRISFQKVSGAAITPVITAGAQSLGKLTDAIFKLVGVDYITISGLTLQENAANTTTTAASNNMTEFGIALLRASTTDGAQYDSIIGNTISLNRTYTNSIGIYSNSSHNSDTATLSTTNPISNATGANSYNKIFSNSISNVNIGIAVIGSTASGLYDLNNEIGASGLGNTITNWGGALTTTAFGNMPNSGTIAGTAGIFETNQLGETVAYNTVTSANLNGAVVNMRGVHKMYTTSPASIASTYTSAINNNTIGMSCAFTSGTTYDFSAIRVDSIKNLISNLTLNINNNTITNNTISLLAGSTPTIVLINVGSSAPGTFNINGNTIKSFTSNATAGSFKGIEVISGTSAISSLSISNNIFGGSLVGDSIVTAFGAITGINHTGSTVVSKTINSNSFRNIRGISSVTMIVASAGTTSSSTNSNTINSVISTSTFIGFQFTGTAGTATLNSNTINNITSNSTLYGIVTTGGTSSLTIDQNTISNLTTTSGSSNVIGMNLNIATTVSNSNISNLIVNATNPTTASIYGIQVVAGSTITGNNLFGFASNAITGTATTGIVDGIYISGGTTTTNVSKNRIYNLSLSRQSTSTCVNGIHIGSTATAINIYNNFISDLRSDSCNSTDGIRGISNTNATLLATYNVFFNTVYLNATSKGTNFGSSGVYQTANSTPSTGQLNLRNNLIINQCVSKGTGNTVALRRSAAAATLNYGAGSASNYNVFYAGDTTLNNYLYSDGTNLSKNITGLQTFGTKDANSFTTLPNFVNSSTTPYDLHLVASLNCAASDNGEFISTYTDDYDGQTRSLTTPDIGADEFTSTGAGAGVWTGSVSSDWNDGRNWCGEAPNTTTDVTINTGATFYPIISSSSTPKCKSLNITGGSVTVSGTGKLTVYNTLTRSAGTFDVSDGTIELAGSSAQTIPASIFTSNNIKNLVINNSSVSLAGTLNLTGKLSFAGSSRRFTTNDNLVLKSTSSGTASVGNIEKDANTNATVSGNVITGKVTVERYLQAKKAWRLLSSPTVHLNQTIKQAWMEGGSANSNPNPGYGIQITSERSTWSSDGFDAQTTAGPSMKIYNPATIQWDGLTSTNANFGVGKAYMTFVRGDRSVTSYSQTATSTTLREKDSLNMGNVIVSGLGSAGSQFATVGNPYASAISLVGITRSNLDSTYYLWDPKLGLAADYGGYQTVSVVNSVVTITPSGASYASGNKVIESGQGFFVRTNNGVGSITFKESNKVDGSYLVARPPSNAFRSLRANILRVQNGQSGLVDGVINLYDSSFSNDVDATDAVKLKNAMENLSINNATGTLLSIERRDKIKINDTIFYKLNQVRISNYQFEFIPEYLDDMNLQAFLEDTYLNTKSPISLSAPSIIDFNIVNDAGSYNPDRFRVIFKVLRPVPVTFVNVKAVKEENKVRVSWNVANEINIKDYGIERSSDGVHFEEIGNVLSNNVPSYSFIDESPFAGINYYRIRNNGFNNEKGYSNIVKVAIQQEPSITMFPNPVKENEATYLRFVNMSKGTYQIRVLNNLGQTVMKKLITHNGVNGQHLLDFNRKLMPGNYSLEIVNEIDKTKTTIKFLF